jgi:hypothetical protein
MLILLHLQPSLTHHLQLEKGIESHQENLHRINLKVVVAVPVERV